MSIIRIAVHRNDARLFLCYYGVSLSVNNPSESESNLPSVSNKPLSERAISLGKRNLHRLH